MAVLPCGTTLKMMTKGTRRESSITTTIFRTDGPHALTKLHVGLCSCYSETLQQVTALTNLQHFTFTKPGYVGESCRGIRSEPPVLRPHLDSGFFKALTNLTHLELDTFDSLPGGECGVCRDGSLSCWLQLSESVAALCGQS